MFISPHTFCCIIILTLSFFLYFFFLYSCFFYSLYHLISFFFFFFFSSRRRHTRLTCDWSSDVCSSDLLGFILGPLMEENLRRAMLLSRGDPMTFIYKPISAGFIIAATILLIVVALRSEERRVGKEGRSRWSPYR